MKMDLSTALQNGIVKVGDYFNYDLKVKEYSIDDTKFCRCKYDRLEETYVYTTKYTHKFKTEKLYWRINTYKGEVILLPDSPIDDKFTLCGIELEQHINDLNNICNALFKNESIADKAVSIDLEIWKATMENEILSYGEYWLASSNIRRNEMGIYFEIYSVEKHVYGEVEMCGRAVYLDDEYGCEVCPKSNHLRPVVFLKKNLKVYLSCGDGTKENPWNFTF